MASQWYYLKDEKQEGPVSSDELKKLAGNGTLDPEDLIWKEGMGDWVPARRLKGLPFEQAKKQSSAKPADATAAKPKEDPARPEVEISGLTEILPNEEPVAQHPTASDDIIPIDEIVSKEETVPIDEAVSDDAVSIDEAVAPVQDDAVPIDEAVSDDPVPIDQAVSDDAVPIEQAVAPVQDDAVPIEQAVSQDEGPRLSNRMPPAGPGLLWSNSLAVGAALFVLSFASPWWSMTLDGSNRTSRQFTHDQRRESVQAHNEGRRFLFEHRKLTSFSWNRRMTYLIWGWHTTSGIAALVLGVFVLVSAIVFSMVRVLTNWAWIIRFAAIIPGIIGIIVFLVWLLDTPGDDVDPFISQGIVLGPYYILSGGLILLVTGIVGGVAGVGQFKHARRMRQGFAY